MALFELKVSNSVNNETQHVAGLFGTGTGDGFVPQRCLLGTICVQNGLLPLEGYEEFDKYNGNSWYFNAAPTGFVDGFTGDRTGLYVFDDYDVNKLESEAERLVIDLGQKTLDSKLPKDERGDQDLNWRPVCILRGDKGFEFRHRVVVRGYVLGAYGKAAYIAA